MEDLPLGIIAALMPEFAVKDLPLGRTLMIYRLYSGPTYIIFSFTHSTILVNEGFREVIFRESRLR